MCGVVTFFGGADGLTHVLEALQLLQYRAPDSAGIATIDTAGELIVRRAVGTADQLITEIITTPLEPYQPAETERIAALLRRQGLALDPGTLRDCAAYPVAQLFQRNGLRIGIGDRGQTGDANATYRPPFSQQMGKVIDAAGGDAGVLTADPVRVAFRLIGAQVAGRARVDVAWREALDEALWARLPAGRYDGWLEAWAEEVELQVPGLAFAVAVRHFQLSFPGLAGLLTDDDWERCGGLTALALAQVVVGHGRWAMIGGVTTSSAHPLFDRSRTRAVCENGSHNASLMLTLRAEQEAWWRARGVAPEEPVHRSQNTTEVIAYEWERVCEQLAEGECSPGSEPFLRRLDEAGIVDPDERALRLTLWRLRDGNAIACSLYSQRRPDRLYTSSHDKPIAIARRTIRGDDSESRHELMISSDVNAALMLWSGGEVDAAAAEMQSLQERADRGELDAAAAHEAIEAILDQFTVEAIFLDSDLCGGKELLACINNQIWDNSIVPVIAVSQYDGTPVPVTPQTVRLNPALVGKPTYPTYLESHLAEIPAMLDEIIKVYVREGKIELDSVWEDEKLVWPGLNHTALQAWYGRDLSQLERLLLIGEGGSWATAQAAAPLFRKLLPDVVVNVYRPVQVLNLGPAVDAEHDLAIEISWSGTTDSLLKTDSWLAEKGVRRLVVTGRVQSDLGRRTARSAGVIDVRSGVEVSVAGVKGYVSSLLSLNLLALRLAETRPGADGAAALAELSGILPERVRQVITDEARRARLREIARHHHHCNKVAIIDNSPLALAAELKIEEMGQLVAIAVDFQAATLRPLIERNALVADGPSRILLIINATTEAAQREAGAIIGYVHSLGLSCLIHTTSDSPLLAWEGTEGIELFTSPRVSPLLQPLVDAPFFLDLAIALAYARGLSPAEIDRPRNLAKSVTTTGAERRDRVEARPELVNISLADFARRPAGEDAWDAARPGPSPTSLRATAALRVALSPLTDPLPARLGLTPDSKHLVVVAATEAIENGVQMAGPIWQQLLGIDVTTYRRYIHERPSPPAGTALLQLEQAGVILTVQDDQTITLPADLTPLQMELLVAVYLSGVAVRLARRRGLEADEWERGLAQLPLLLAELLTDNSRSEQVRATLEPWVRAGYDKIQVIGGGLDYAAAASIARSLRMRGFMAEALYTDSAWHGPLAAVGGPGPDRDVLIVILATDPLFQAAALVDTQVYRTREAQVVLVVPAGNEKSAVVRGVDAGALLSIPAVPRPFLAPLNAALGELLAREMEQLWKTALD